MKKTQIPVMFNDLEPQLASNTQKWEGGTTYGYQRQHIPGYKGFVPSIKCENLHGQTFSKTTSKAFNMNDQIEKQNKFNRFITHNQQFYDEQNENQNKENNKLKIIEKEVNYEDVYENPKRMIPNKRIPIPGYQGYIPQYRNPLKKFKNKQQIYDKAIETQQQVTIKTVNEKDLKIPVVGYKGFVPKVKGIDYDGINFKDSYIDQKIKQCMNEI